MILALVGGLSSGAYALRFQVMAVVEQLPLAAQRFREAFRDQDGQAGTLSKMQEAAKEIEKTADSVAGNDARRGVTKVQIEEPAFAARAYLWAGSLGAVSLAGQALMVLLLTFFLLLSDDLFKRKLVEGIPTFTRKKLTVQVLDQIADQIERFLLVQVFTSVVVGLATWAALWALGLQQPAVWGLMAGVFNSIPYFGPVYRHRRPDRGCLPAVRYLHHGPRRGRHRIDHHVSRGVAADAHAPQSRRQHEPGLGVRRPHLLELDLGRLGDAAGGAHADGREVGVRPRRGSAVGGQFLGE